MEQGALIAWAVGSFILTAGMTACCVWLAYRPPSSRLERRVNARVNQLELEWSDTFDKLNSIVGRVTKRQGLERKQDADKEPTNGQVRTSEGRTPGGARAALFKNWKEKRREHVK